jgi:putative transposase
MANYRRVYVAGATYFFTVNLADRTRRTLIDHVAALRCAFRATKASLAFDIDAIVILPDHLHCIWTMPPGDCDFSTRWRLVKARFSHMVPRSQLVQLVSPSKADKHERGVWQRRFWEHLICDDADYAAHLAYIHYNPVKHGHARQAADWPYSSFHRFVRTGVYPRDWAGNPEIQGRYGE